MPSPLPAPRALNLHIHDQSSTPLHALATYKLVLIERASELGALGPGVITRLHHGNIFRAFACIIS